VLPCSWFENLEKKEKEMFHLKNNVLLQNNYSVNVSVFGLVEKELGFERNGPIKRIDFFLLDVNS